MREYGPQKQTGAQPRYPSAFRNGSRPLDTDQNTIGTDRALSRTLTGQPISLTPVVRRPDAVSEASGPDGSSVPDEATGVRRNNSVCSLMLEAAAPSCRNIRNSYRWQRRSTSRSKQEAGDLS